MDSPIPPDPYVALGISSDADADAIKKAYRKLALKLHPDKCTDESQKASRTDEFTKIQQAYDILGDEERRGRYDAQIRLAELRRQNMEMHSRAAPRMSEPRPAPFNVRTAAPREASYSARTPPRPAYEEVPRARYYNYEDEYEATRGSTRKTNVADEYVYVKRPSPREEKRERVRPTVDPRDEDRRREAKRRDTDVREQRSSKYTNRDSYEEDRRRRDREYEDMKRRADAYDNYGSSSSERNLDEKLREARRHMASQSTRPSMPRRESSRQVPQYREPEVRRSSAAPKDKERTRDSRRSSPSKEERRRMAENVRPPNLSSHVSSPPVMESMPPPPSRSFTQPIEVERKKKSKDASPPPTFHRSTTQPAESMPTSSRQRDMPFRARPEDSGYASGAGTPGSYSIKYSYADEPAAANVSYSNGHRTVLREPTSSSRRTSPSPVRVVPSKTAAKMKGLDPKSVKRTQTSYPTGERPTVVEAQPKSSSSRRERERVREPEYTSRPRYFGEDGMGTTSDPRYTHVPAPSRDEYSRRFEDADVRYHDPRGRADNFTKPSFMRSATFAGV